MRITVHSFVIMLLIISEAYDMLENNVCKTLEDYETLKRNPNCWYNPDVTATVNELVTRNGYPFEEYESLTTDGYILSTFRIPNPNTTKGVVYLQHPLLCIASVWVDKGNSSLGFLLYNAGYDVWMGSFRGGSNSRHSLYSKNGDEYWNYSIHEMGIYDIPAQLDVVRNHSNHPRLYYIGHSMGTTAAYIYSSLLPEHSKNSVHTFVMISPVVFHSHTTSPLVFLGPFGDLLMGLSKAVRYRSIVEYDGLIHKFLKWFCFYVPKMLPLCMLAITKLFGGNEGIKRINPEWYPHFFHQSFREFSVKAGIHYTQHMLNGKFQFYNYGSDNIKIYGHPEPPSYPLKNVTVPTYVLYGDKDFFTAEEDISSLFDSLPQPAKIYGKQKIIGYDHLDFLYGRDVKSKVYDVVVEFLNNLSCS